MVAFADNRILTIFKSQGIISGRNKTNNLVVEINIMKLEDNYNSLCKPNLGKANEHSEIIPPASADKGGFTNI